MSTRIWGGGGCKSNREGEGVCKIHTERQQNSALSREPGESWSGVKEMKNKNQRGMF